MSAKTVVVMLVAAWVTTATASVYDPTGHETRVRHERSVDFLRQMREDMIGNYTASLRSIDAAIKQADDVLLERDRHSWDRAVFGIETALVFVVILGAFYFSVQKQQRGGLVDWKDEKFFISVWSFLFLLTLLVTASIY